MNRSVRIALALSVVGLLLAGYVMWRGTRSQRPTFRNRADLAEVGIEVYPGARLEGGQTVSYYGDTTSVAWMRTPDDLPKVAGWYRDRYPKPKAIEEGARGRPQALLLTISDSMDVFVREDNDRGGTSIMLQHHTGARAAGLKKAGE